MATRVAEAMAQEILPSSYIVTFHEGGVDAIDRVADEWRDLCRRATDDQPFYRPDWIQAYIRAFVPGATVVLITTHLTGVLHFVLPLIRERAWVGGIPVRKLRAPVNSHPGRFDAVRSSGPEGEGAVRASWEHLVRIRDWDLLELAHAPEESTVQRFAAEAQVREFPVVRVSLSASPYVEVPPLKEMLSQLPPNAKLRSQLRQVRRQLEEQGPMTLRRIETADRSMLEKFYQLEASGWKGKDGSAITCRAETRKFYDEIADAAARSSCFSLYFLEWSNHLLAAHFGLSHDGRYYSPKVAYDEKFKKYAPGHLILNEILKDCTGRGIREIDITGPSDDWKMKWTSQARPNYTYFIFNKGFLATLAHTFQFKLRPMASRLRHRRKKAV
jgi:CelD/BcsL family acetyltransferase involved in cellulose biosynthesis